MELAYAFAANAAESLQDGRFSVLGGGLDGFIVPEVPARASVTLVVVIKFKHDECLTSHKLRASVFHPNPSSGISNIGVIEFFPTVNYFFPDADVMASAILNVTMLFTSIGLYEFRFSKEDDKKILGGFQFGIATRVPDRDS